MSFLPVLIVGGAIVALSGKKKRRRRSTSKALPPSNDRGEVFRGEDPPDVIMNPAGARFSVAFQENSGTGHIWELSASPADDSIEAVSTSIDSLSSQSDDVGKTDRVFVFEGRKAGEGSLVFHLVRPWMKGKEPPVEIVEILTKIS